MADYTVDALIESARRRGQLTRSAGSLDLPDLVELMDEELKAYLMPFLISLKEEYAVDTYDFTVQSGVSSYALPPRAIGGKIREVMVLDEDKYRRLSRVEPTRMLQPSTATGAPDRYYFEGNKLVVDPCDTAQIRVKYFRRPGRLVLAADAGKVTAIDVNAKTVTLSAVPETFVPGATYDFIQAQPYFETLGEDLAVTGVDADAGTVVFSATLPATLAVGDFLALAGESPVPQIPVELHSLLAKRTNVVALEALGDSEGLKMAQAMLADAEKRAHFLVDDRDEGAPRYIINRNGPGFRRFHTRFR